jgi:hypothetical protein
MSELHRDTRPGDRECWCLECLFKRLDAKNTAVRATELYDARGTRLDPLDEAWLKGQDAPKQD